MPYKDKEKQKQYSRDYYPKKNRKRKELYHSSDERRKDNILKTRKWYWNNVEKVCIRRLKNKEENKRKLFSILGKRCSKCGFSDERALEFNHIDSSKKLKGGEKYNRYLREINNLEVVCSNCHQIITHEQHKLKLIKTGKRKPIISGELKNE